MVPPDAKEAKNKGGNNSRFKQRERERETDGEREMFIQREGNCHLEKTIWFQKSKERKNDKQLRSK
jgi:hypothetical protein